MEPTDKIKSISESVDEISPQISSFVKAFNVLYKIHVILSETLMAKLIELDSIESSGNDEIRALRKEQIDRIQEFLSQLDQCEFRKE